MAWNQNLRIRKLIYAALVAAGVGFAATGPYWIKQADFLLADKNAGSGPSALLPETGQKASPDRLVIARLQIDAPIVYIDYASNEAFKTALQDGVVHYPGVAGIGEPGNAYLFGHSSDYIWAKGDYKTVFALLPKIKIGDEIAATDREGKVFVYAVTETKIVAPDDLSVLAQPQDGRRLLTLQTSYPVGTALRRFIVIAGLQSEP